LGTQTEIPFDAPAATLLAGKVYHRPSGRAAQR
jgi:hypothetical protein